MLDASKWEQRQQKNNLHDLRNGELNPGLPGASLDHGLSLKTGYVCHYTISEVIDEESLDCVNIYLRNSIGCGFSGAQKLSTAARQGVTIEAERKRIEWWRSIKCHHLAGGMYQVPMSFVKLSQFD